MKIPKLDPLNFILAGMMVVGISYPFLNTGEDIPERPPVQIAVQAPDKAIEILFSMATDCDIAPLIEAALDDNILTSSEAFAIGDQCVAEAEAELTKDNPHALDIIRNLHRNKGGLSM